MKLQDIKARTFFREQYKPGMTIDAYGPDAIKNALIFINKKIVDAQTRIARLEKERNENNGEWTHPSSAEAYQQAVANLQDLQSQAKKLNALSKTVVTNTDIDNLWNRIKVECSDYLAACGRAQTWLYRGMGSKENRPAFLEKSPEHRKPVDSNPMLVRSFDQSLQQLGFVARRENSIFCSSNRDTAGAFGHIYVIFPRNGFDFTYTNEREIILDELEQVLSTKYITSWHQAVKNIAKRSLNQFPLLLVNATAHQMWFIVQRNRDILLSQGFPQNLIDNLRDPEYIERKYKPQKTNLYNALQQSHEVYVHGEYYALRWDFYRKSLAFWMNEIQNAPLSEQQSVTEIPRNTQQVIPTELDQYNQQAKVLNAQLARMYPNADPKWQTTMDAYNILQSKMRKPQLAEMPITQRVWAEIQQRCGQILKAMAQTQQYLWHGTKQSIGSVTFVSTSPSMRLPMNSDPEVSKIFNWSLDQLGFRARRDNSTFVTSDRSLAQGFGSTYVILPWDNQYEFTYTREHDLILTKRKLPTLVNHTLAQQLYERFHKLPAQDKDKIMIYSDIVKGSPEFLVLWLVQYENQTQILKYLSEKTGMSSRWQDYVDLAKFENLYQPSKTNLAYAMEQGVEIYLTGKYYALRANPVQQEADWWPLLQMNKPT